MDGHLTGYKCDNKNNNNVVNGPVAEMSSMCAQDEKFFTPDVLTVAI